MNSKTNKIYAIETDVFRNKEFCKEALKKIPLCRQEKYNKLKLEEEKALSLGASIVLVEALKDFGIEENEISIDINKYGAPYLTNNQEIYFNISHSGKMAVCIAGYHISGIDIEKKRKYNEKIVNRFFSKDEKEYLLGISKESVDEEFTRIWTLKESFVKLSREGFYLPPDRFSVVSRDNYNKYTINLDKIVKDNNEQPAFFYEYGDLDEYKMAICMNEAILPNEIYLLDYRNIS